MRVYVCKKGQLVDINDDKFQFIYYEHYDAYKVSLTVQNVQDSNEHIFPTIMIGTGVYLSRLINDLFYYKD